MPVYIFLSYLAQFFLKYKKIFEANIVENLKSQILQA